MKRTLFLESRPTLSCVAIRPAARLALRVKGQAARPSSPSARSGSQGRRADVVSCDLLYSLARRNTSSVEMIGLQLRRRRCTKAAAAAHDKHLGCGVSLNGTTGTPLASFGALVSVEGCELVGGGGIARTQLHKGVFQNWF